MRGSSVEPGNCQGTAGRKKDGGVGAGYVFERDERYFAPVTAHFGDNNIKQYTDKELLTPSELIGGSTFERIPSEKSITNITKAFKVSTQLDEDDLMIINKSGLTIRMKISDLRVMGRATQGVRLINIKGNDSIAAVTKVLREEESENDEFEGDVENGTDIETENNDSQE